MSNNEEVTITILMEEKLKKAFDKKCIEVHRSMASQIRFLIEMWLSGKLEVKPSE